MRQLNMSVTNGELVSPSAGAGFVEEVNATRLAITLSGELAEADIDYYLLNAVPCDADGSTYGDRQLSERIYASGEAEPGYVSEEVLYFNLVPSLTLHRRMKLQLEAHRLAADGTIASVVKSSVAVICFGESVVGESNAFSAQMRGLIADFRREVAAASNIIAQTRVMLGGMSIDRLDDALTAFETARDTAIAAFETAADSSIEAFEDHTHNNISSLAKLQENSSGKPMYAADMLGTFSLAQNANALPASPGVGDLCYVSSNLLPCESLTLQTGTQYSKLYFNHSPVLPEAAFDITLTKGSDEVNICYEAQHGIVIVYVNFTPVYAFNPSASAIIYPGLYDNTDCEFPSGWSKLNTQTLVFDDSSSFYCGDSLSPGGDYTGLSRLCFYGYTVSSVYNHETASYVQEFAQTLVGTTPCYNPLNKGYWCYFDGSWKRTLLGRLSADSNPDRLLFNGGWIDVVKYVENAGNTFEENSMPGMTVESGESGFTAGENGELYYAGRQVEMKTQVKTVSSSAYSAQVAATAIPAVTPDPANGIEGSDAVDGYYTISPDTMYDFGEAASLNLRLAPGASGLLNEYMFRFSCGASAATFALPSEIDWVGDEPEIFANTSYECSIVNNRAVIA